VSFSDLYRSRCAQRGFQSDSQQDAAVRRLQRLESDFDAFKQARSHRVARWFHPPVVPRGVWLWGGVGRGKSFLLDCFFESIELRRKTRVHFHEFMRSVHRELEQLKGQSDPLDAVAASIAKRYRLVCFDEFHVSDIADAMILERLLRALFRHGVSFVMTSNYQPTDLYPDGLHRDRILPAIELLQSQLDILCVDAGIDYRRRESQQLETFLVSPLRGAADARLTQMFDALVHGADENASLRVAYRELRARRCAQQTVWFDFAELCGGPRSQNDYLDLAARFQNFLVSDVPEMGPSQHSEARRFTWLVDVLYDLRLKLIVSAAVPPERLYPQGRMANEFARTLSRLTEMQSQEYLDAPTRSVTALMEQALPTETGFAQNAR
jgi:cell division protein ZapE